MLHSETKAPWTPCFFRISDNWPLCANPHTCTHMVSHFDPSTPWKMAWQMTCQSSSTRGGLASFVYHIRGVDERAQCSLCMCTQCELTHSLPNNSSRKVCREPRFQHFPQLQILLTLTNLDRSMVVCHDELSEFIILSRLLSCNPRTTILTGLSPFLLVCQELGRLVKLSHIPCGAGCARNTFASRRSVPPQAAYHQLHCFFPCPEETRQRSLQAGIGGNAGTRPLKRLFLDLGLAR